jgi:predicted phosphodiesterase
MEGWDLQSRLGSDTGEPSMEEVASWLPQPSRILLLADIHANWHALVSVLKDAQGRYDATWFLGDVAGYGPRPMECVRFLREHLGFRGGWVIGNHDSGVVKEYRQVLPAGTPSQEALWTWERHREELEEESAELYKWYKEAVAPPMASPVKQKYGSGVQVFVHANLVDFVGDYSWPDNYRNRLLEDLRELTSEGNAWLLTGHTHMVNLIRFHPDRGRLEWLPITYGQSIDLAQGIYSINPGSVGQPRDGDRRAAYAILDVEHSAVTFYRVEYDVQRVQGEMQRAGYPDILIERLWTARIPETRKHFDNVYRREQGGLSPVMEGGME